MLGFYGVGVTNLQYFCGGKKIVYSFIQTKNYKYND